MEDGVEAFDPTIDVDLRRKVSEALDREEIALSVLTQLFNQGAVDIGGALVFSAQVGQEDESIVVGFRRLNLLGSLRGKLRSLVLAEEIQTVFQSGKFEL